MYGSSPVSVTGSNHGSSHGSRRDIDSLALGSILGKQQMETFQHFSHPPFSRPRTLEGRQEVAEVEKPQHWKDRPAQTSTKDINTEPGL